MLRLLNFRCSFCSNPLDETHVYSRRLMLHMLFGADPSTFARVYTAKDAA